MSTKSLVTDGEVLTLGSVLWNYRYVLSFANNIMETKSIIAFEELRNGFGRHRITQDCHGEEHVGHH